MANHSSSQHACTALCLRLAEGFGTDSCHDDTGWPIPPGSEPWCSACPEGWATTTVDAGFCQMCTPGTFAATAQSPACSACPAGAYANTWGTTACKHCIMGTFSNSSVSSPACLCLSCTKSCMTCQMGFATLVPHLVAGGFSLVFFSGLECTPQQEFSSTGVSRSAAKVCI